MEIGREEKSQIDKMSAPLAFLNYTGMNFNFHTEKVVVQSSIALNNKLLSQVVSWMLQKQLSEQEIRNHVFEMCFSSPPPG